ncbi:hypothetical protein E2C01_009176 [Portunus trituberculatus]|uniref:Uncharacterized protein n=1 Tax=Portunus trituberculatus TaxID=210409 RepID=A0A5B7D5Q2_PORTR|nr:hypothetical protein [Portunus trituberculatus]
MEYGRFQELWFSVPRGTGARKYPKEGLAAATHLPQENHLWSTCTIGTLTLYLQEETHKYLMDYNPNHTHLESVPVLCVLTICLMVMTVLITGINLGCCHNMEPNKGKICTQSLVIHMNLLKWYTFTTAK